MTEVTALVFEIFFDSSRSRSSMFRKSVLPPKLSCEVWAILTPRSCIRWASSRWTMVAPTWLLMSSPMIGRPRSLKRFCQYGSRPMKTGMQFTKAQPARRICSTYHLVASSEPTGR